jgi:hypothetical protein
MEFAPGLGATYFRHLEMFWENGNELVYFNKGGETWGTPVATNCAQLVGLEENPGRIRAAVTISPNPVRKGEPVRITINPPSAGLRFTLYHLTGRQLFNCPVESDQITLNTDTLAPGMYLWHLTDGISYQTGKLIVN